MSIRVKGTKVIVGFITIAWAIWLNFLSHPQLVDPEAHIVLLFLLIVMISAATFYAIAESIIEDTSFKYAKFTAKIAVVIAVLLLFVTLPDFGWLLIS